MYTFPHHEHEALNVGKKVMEAGEGKRGGKRKIEMFCLNSIANLYSVPWQNRDLPSHSSLTKSATPAALRLASFFSLAKSPGCPQDLLRLLPSECLSQVCFFSSPAQNFHWVRGFYRLNQSEALSFLLFLLFFLRLSGVSVSSPQTRSTSQGVCLLWLMSTVIFLCFSCFSARNTDNLTFSWLPWPCDHQEFLQ